MPRARATTSCSGTPLEPPFPEGIELRDLRHGLLLGRRADVLAAPTASTRPPSATRAASRRTRRTRRCAAAAPATPRSCSSSSTRRQTSYEALLRIFWESHDPTQGMRQGNDVGTQYRSAIYWTTDAQRDAARASRDMFQARLAQRGLRRDHDRDRRGRARSTTPRTTTSSTSRRTRTATAGSAAPASRARSASASAPRTDAYGAATPTVFASSPSAGPTSRCAAYTGMIEIEDDDERDDVDDRELLRSREIREDPDRQGLIASPR